VLQCVYSKKQDCCTSVKINLCQNVLYHIGNCISLCQYREGFLLVIFVPTIGGDILADPIAVDLTAAESLRYKLGMYVPEYSDDEEGASLQEDMVAAVEGGSSSEEDGCDSEAEEEYLAELKVTLVESELKEDHKLPRRHYYMPS
jgi:hypothetical protein